MSISPEPGRVIRWGILGAGGIAATVGADIASTPGNEIVAVGARDGARAAAFAQRFGIPRSYGSYRELVADDDVDVVYIATTHAQHHEQALLALNAGKPVLVEKSFTLNARQARDVVDTARRNRLFCMEGMWMRLNPLIREAHADRGIRPDRRGGQRARRSLAALRVRPVASPLRPRRRRRRAARPRRLSGNVRLAVPRPARQRADHRIPVAHRLRPDRRAAVGLPRRAVRAGIGHRARPESAHRRRRRNGRLGPDRRASTPGPVHHRARRRRRAGDAPDRQGNGFGPEVTEVGRCLRAGVWRARSSHSTKPWRCSRCSTACARSSACVTRPIRRADRCISPTAASRNSPSAGARSR